MEKGYSALIYGATGATGRVNTYFNLGISYLIIKFS